MSDRRTGANIDGLISVVASASLKFGIAPNLIHPGNAFSADLMNRLPTSAAFAPSVLKAT